MIVRIHLLLILILIATTCVIGQNTTPNIIFILTDDQRWDALGYSGNDIIQTPEMDKLAAEGVYFKNAFVTTPICAASRATIITGLYERKHDYTFQKPPLKKEHVADSYFHKLKEAGYYSGFIGKMGVRFEDKLDTTLFDVYRPEKLYHYFQLHDGQHRHLTNIMGDKAINFIEEASTDQPFCLSISFYAPHAVDDHPDQYMWPESLDTLLQDVTIPSASLSDSSYFQQLPLSVRQGFNRTRWKWRYDHPKKYQEMVKGYYRMITNIDITLGHIRKTLETEGLSDNTIIILMGDNGYFMGERQLAGKWLMYEPSLRVPLIIYDPTSPKSGTVEDLVLNADIAPTILDFAKVPVPKSYQGKSLKPYVSHTAGTIQKRRDFLCEHLWDFDHIPASEGIRTERYKYFRYLASPKSEEVYDLLKDPNEIDNLAHKKGYEELTKRLRNRCEDLIDQISTE